MVYIIKLFHDYGRGDKLRNDYLLDNDYFWELQYEAMENVTDCTFWRTKEYDNTHRFYYYDTAMTEFYRLCREYDSLRGIVKRNNPYFTRAEATVYDALHNVYDSLGYTLHTKTNHPWSCRLIVEFDGDYFDEYRRLLESLLHIFDFYHKEVEVLRAKLQTLKSKTKEAA
jgi:hypothetical protein